MTSPTIDFANNIGGTGSVVKSGDETLTLSGANSYTGGTTIR
ncbi:autotransporter-associated beta strand repeat-containing protein, partial [Salmonella enterica]